MTQVLQSAGGVRLIAQVDTNGGSARPVDVTFTFDHPASVTASGPSDWTCADSRGGPLTTARVSGVTCRYQYAGTTPPALTLDLARSSNHQPLSGTVALQSGSDTSSDSFTG
ncbi:hypothetical protein [Nocardioides ultimimeridianus]